MNFMLAEPGQNWEMLLAAWQRLNLPDGWRAEIIECSIVLAPPNPNSHSFIASELHKALAEGLSRDSGVYQILRISVPEIGALYVPDLAVVPRSCSLSGSDVDPVPADELSLVVEITSRGNARHDRLTKRWGYAHAPVPLYLLIDCWDENGPAVTLFSDPESGDYRHSERMPFGESIAIPAPFNLQLEPAGFPVPAGSSATPSPLYCGKTEPT